ncbi:MAG: insulinase family protein [Candidatus Competibacter sp.]|nr:insulinase family protein [Candidatus Competibacter sp.]MDG4583823.1 insulinase family protein [Candidatus Competibacter sp.]
MHHPAFQHLRSHPVPALRLEFQEYRHRATGARHLHLAADDPHNAFMVAFLTVPQDSTGVAHILEHTALCGSRRYPVRDPFFMMIRRSLNTFMNAFTSSDWTAYPFASQNKKDFNNLLDVYLDAAFFPLLDERDFAQEGHRLEFAQPDDPNSELLFKGVVFNEMKGALSSPVQRLGQELQHRLFPTITYHHNSGGDPEAIPDLTHERLRAFHARHYHPSNAIFLTYGDIPAAEHQQRFETQALNRFQALTLDLAIPDERRLSAPLADLIHYPLDGTEDPSDQTHIVLGWLLGPITDPLATLRARLLSDALLDNSSSPLRNALETSELGAAPSPLCGFDTATREATFVCGLEGSNPEHAEAVETLVLEVLQQVAADGVPQEAVDAALHQLELSEREITGDGFPYGLRLLMEALTPAIHGADPLPALDSNPLLEQLRLESRDPEFIPRLARQLLLDNPHRVRLTMAPDAGLSAKQAAAERERLAAIRAALADADKTRLVEQARILTERQQRQDDPELLPKVGLEDVPPDLKIAEGVARPVGALPAAWYAQGTNGMVYLQAVLDLPALDPEELDLLPLLCACLPEVGSAGRDYRATQARQAAVTGGIGARASVRGEVDDVHRVKGVLVLTGKALARNQAALSELLWETLTSPRFDELPRLRELVAQMRAQREEAVTDHGHMLALAAASAGLSPTAALSHRWEGLQGLRDLKALDESLDDPAALAAFAARLERLRDRLQGAPRQLLVVSEAERREAIAAALATHWRDVATSKVEAFALAAPEASPARQGFSVNTQVNFCAKAYPTVAPNHPDAPALHVLGDFLRNGHLHRAIREQGGAYGGGAGYHPDSGAFRFYSYRDPRLADTLADFDRALDWLQGHDHPARTLEEAILGIIAAIDKPGSPAGEAIGAFFGALFGRTPEQRRAYRQRVLAVTLDDLKRVAANYLRPEQAHCAVLSNARTLAEQRDFTIVAI